MSEVIGLSEYLRKHIDTDRVKEGEAPFSDEEWKDFEKNQDFLDALNWYKEFTRMHVEAALKAASELAINLSDSPINHELILTCYTEKDIK